MTNRLILCLMIRKRVMASDKIPVAKKGTSATSFWTCLRKFELCRRHKQGRARLTTKLLLMIRAVCLTMAERKNKVRRPAEKSNITSEEAHPVCSQKRGKTRCSKKEGCELPEHRRRADGQTDVVVQDRMLERVTVLTLNVSRSPSMGCLTTSSGQRRRRLLIPALRTSNGSGLFHCS